MSRVAGHQDVDSIRAARLVCKPWNAATQHCITAAVLRPLSKGGQDLDDAGNLFLNSRTAVERRPVSRTYFESLTLRLLESDYAAAIDPTPPHDTTLVSVKAAEAAEVEANRLAETLNGSWLGTARRDSDDADDPALGRWDSLGWYPPEEPMHVLLGHSDTDSEASAGVDDTVGGGPLNDSSPDDDDDDAYVDEAGDVPTPLHDSPSPFESTTPPGAVRFHAAQPALVSVHARLQSLADPGTSLQRQPSSFAKAGRRAASARRFAAVDTGHCAPLVVENPDLDEFSLSLRAQVSKALSEAPLPPVVLKDGLGSASMHRQSRSRSARGFDARTYYAPSGRAGTSAPGNELSSNATHAVALRAHTPPPLLRSATTGDVLDPRQRSGLNGGSVHASPELWACSTQPCSQASTPGHAQDEAPLPLVVSPGAVADIFGQAERLPGAVNRARGHPWAQNGGYTSTSAPGGASLPLSAIAENGAAPRDVWADRTGSWHPRRGAASSTGAGPAAAAANGTLTWEEHHWSLPHGAGVARGMYQAGGQAGVLSGGDAIGEDSDSDDEQTASAELHRAMTAALGASMHLVQDDDTADGPTASPAGDSSTLLCSDSALASQDEASIGPSANTSLIRQFPTARNLFFQQPTRQTIPGWGRRNLLRPVHVYGKARPLELSPILRLPLVDAVHVLASVSDLAQPPQLAALSRVTSLRLCLQWRDLSWGIGKLRKVSFNQQRHTPSWTAITALPRLSALDLTGSNGITLDHVAKLTALSSLVSLNLTGVHLPTEALHTFMVMTQLTRLRIPDVALSSDGVFGLPQAASVDPALRDLVGALPGLRHLDLYYTGAGEGSPAVKEASHVRALAAATQLRRLDIAKLQQVTDMDLWRLRKLTALTALRLGCNTWEPTALAGKSFTMFARFEHLHVLHIEACTHLRTYAYAAIACSCPHLKYLHYDSAARVSAAVFQLSDRMQNLEVLEAVHLARVPNKAIHEVCARMPRLLAGQAQRIVQLKKVPGPHLQKFGERRRILGLTIV